MNGKHFCNLSGATFLFTPYPSTTTSVKCITAADSHNNNNNKNISFVLLYARPRPCRLPSTQAFSFQLGQRRVGKNSPTHEISMCTIILLRSLLFEKEKRKDRERERERENYRGACEHALTENPRSRFIRSQFDFRIFPERF